MFAHRVIKNNLFKLTLGLFALCVSLTFTSCRPDEQVGGMYEMNFDETTACAFQDKIFNFQNNSDQPVAVLGIRKTAGSDRDGNFSFRSIIINNQETPSISGALKDVTIPAHAVYGLKLRFSPTIVAAGKTNDAYIDMVVTSPKPGVIQLKLKGNSPDTELTSCRSNSEGPQSVSFDGEMLLRVERVIAATNAIDAPINTDQGIERFVPVDIPVVLNAASHTIRLPAYTAENFILPAPRADVPGIGGKIRGSLVVKIPEEKNGTYDPSTGSITLPDVHITMVGSQDFSAELNFDLTTSSLRVDSIEHQPDSALPAFGDPPHFEENTQTGVKEVFGAPLNPEGKVFLVGLSDLSNVTYVRGINTALRGGLSNGAGMAILMEGTLHPRN